MARTPGDVARDWFDGLWNRGDEQTIDELLHPDALIHGLPTPTGGAIRGPAEFKPFYRAFHAAFPDISVDLQQVIEQGDTAACYCRVMGTQRGDLPDLRATNRGVDFTGLAMVRVEDGRAREAWNCFDFLTMYRQLGIDLNLPRQARGA
jgi:predicted ester cyclase